jgi:hypothetical protein
MMIWGSLMMILILEQSLVVMTLAHKLMILARLRRMVTFV